MTTKVVAVAGSSGYVGKAITNALLDTKAFDVRILTRPSSLESKTLQEFKSRGATLHGISYDDEASIVSALQGVDTVVSTLGAGALVSGQVPLIKSAKSAGVKLFWPSEFGVQFEGETPSPVVKSKKIVTQTIQEQGLPSAILSNGAFPDPLGFNFAEKKVTIWGDGNAKVSWTTIASVGRWLAGVLKSVPIEQLQNKVFNITGEVATLNEVVKLWEKKHNDKLQVDYRPIKELDDRIAANVNDFTAFLDKGWAEGILEIRGKLDNELSPGWKPDTIESIL